MRRYDETMLTPKLFYSVAEKEYQISEIHLAEASTGEDWNAQAKTTVL